jgi:hypothetical protein
MNAKKTTQKELPYIIEDFLNIDPAHITLGAIKPNKFQGSSVPIRYKGKALYVTYAAHTCPFGASPSKDEKDEYKQTYALGKKITGYTTSIQCEKDYESDPYYKKAVELDQFFIEQCIQNSVAWGLGGSKTKPIAREAIEGYDDKGDNGKWKRLVKYAYKKNGTEKIYTDYAPRLEFGLLTDAITESKDADGKLVQHATFKTVFFNAEGDKVDQVTADSVESHGSAHSIRACLPNWCKISILAQWTSISLGTYGASLKPKASQIRVFPNERLNNDECMLGGDNEEEDGDFCMPDGLALGGIAPQRVEPVKTAPVQAQAAAKKPAPLVVAEPEEPEEDEVEEASVDDEEEEVEEVVEEPPKPAPAPAKPAPSTARRATRVVAAKGH